MACPSPAGRATTRSGAQRRAAGNVISGNTLQGVRITGANTTGNQLLGNYIGLDSTGTVALKNKKDGVIILNGANNNTVGGSTTGAGNYISGNDEEGVLISGSGTSGNQVLGNTVGLNVNNAAVGNRAPRYSRISPIVSAGWLTCGQWPVPSIVLRVLSRRFVRR